MAERLRCKIEQTMSFTISGGVATARAGDTPVALFLRVDSALYAAKEAGRNRMFWHDGETALSVTDPFPAETPVEHTLVEHLAE